jgi:hypothetical protein
MTHGRKMIPWQLPPGVRGRQGVAKEAARARRLGTVNLCLNYRALGASESVSKLLHRKHIVPITRHPGPGSAPPFR